MPDQVPPTHETPGVPCTGMCEAGDCDCPLSEAEAATPKHAASCDHTHPPGPCPVSKPEGWNPVA